VSFVDPNVFETANAGFAQAMYEEYLRDPAAVGPEWRRLFESGVVGERPENGRGGAQGRTDAEAQGRRDAGSAGLTAAVDAPRPGDPATLRPRASAPPGAVPIKGPAARLVANMTESLAVPTASSMFATVRYIRAVWEHHVGGTLDWWFRYTYPRLEVIPRVNSQVGWSGVGFVECGYPPIEDRPDRRDPLSDNFDIVAHETGHIILKTLIGDPFPHRKPFEYRAHEEAGADLIATLSSLYFDSVVDQLLARTRGNLFGANTLSRFGELRIPRSSTEREVRTLFNRETLASARATMAGAGFMLTFRVRGGAARADALVANLQLLTHATSLGGIETTLERRARYPAERGVPEDLLRVSVGCEHAEDLWQDLHEALEATRRPTSSDREPAQPS